MISLCFNGTELFCNFSESLFHCELKSEELERISGIETKISIMGDRGSDYGEVSTSIDSINTKRECVFVSDEISLRKVVTKGIIYGSLLVKTFENGRTIENKLRFLLRD